MELTGVLLFLLSLMVAEALGTLDAYSQSATQNDAYVLLSWLSVGLSLDCNYRIK